MTSHNKGKKYRLCPECKRKRYCSKIALNQDWWENTCSQGHKWKSEIAHIDKIITIVAEQLIPKLKDLFERDDAFYSYISKRR